MIKEEVIVQKLAISRIGERVYFQIELPYDTKRIIGLEYGVKGLNGVLLEDPLEPVINIMPSFKVFLNKVIGKLSLQVPGRENLFFQGDLSEERNIATNEAIASVVWQPEVWTYCRKREEISLSVESNTSFIEGLFEDSYGVNEYETLFYQLHLYLWIEKCEP